MDELSGVRGRLRLLALALVAALAAAGLAGFGGRRLVTEAAAAGHQSMTVLENSGLLGTWESLDPMGPTGLLEPYGDTIYGDLFEQGTGAQQIIPDLATGYQLIDGDTAVEITLRRGVTFSDGTPFDAQAVAFNFERDFNPANACACLAQFPVSSVSVAGPDAVVIHLTQVDAHIMQAFFGEQPNWIVSPTALQKEGPTQFGLKPVGAGPFMVESNVPNSKLVLARNPHYWQKGRPYLKTLTIETIGSDESAYDAIVSGQAQAYQGFTTYSAIAADSHQVQVHALNAHELGPFVIQLNTEVPPFSNILAREAIYYATDPGPIARAITAGHGRVVESPTYPGSLYYEATVPGYRTYDLAKAKALVKQLGGLSVQLGTINQLVDNEIDAALKAEWDRAGIKTALSDWDLLALVQEFRGGKWQAMTQNAGGSDPALAKGLAFRWAGNAPFTGVHDPVLDQMIAKGLTLNPASHAAGSLYDQIWRYIATKAYSPILFWVPDYSLTLHGVSGPGLTSPLSGFQVIWQDVRWG
jgi:peptide/nickel transport system substrate-binding protein